MSLRHTRQPKFIQHSSSIHLNFSSNSIDKINQARISKKKSPESKKYLAVQLRSSQVSSSVIHAFTYSSSKQRAPATIDTHRIRDTIRSVSTQHTLATQVVLRGVKPEAADVQGSDLFLLWVKQDECGRVCPSD